MGYGSLPTTDLSINSGKEYTFLFSSWSSAESFNQPIQDNVGPYASGIIVKGSGLTTISVTLTPSNVMPLSAWKGLFSEAGLSNMTDLTVGTFETPNTDTGFHPINNITTFYKPMIQSAEDGIGSIFSFAKTSVTYLIVGGIGVLLLYGYMQGRGARPTYKSNPKRRKRYKGR